LATAGNLLRAAAQLQGGGKQMSALKAQLEEADRVNRELGAKLESIASGSKSRLPAATQLLAAAARLREAGAESQSDQVEALKKDNEQLRKVITELRKAKEGPPGSVPASPHKSKGKLFEAGRLLMGAASLSAAGAAHGEVRSLRSENERLQEEVRELEKSNEGLAARVLELEQRGGNASAKDRFKDAATMLGAAARFQQARNESEAKASASDFGPFGD